MVLATAALLGAAIASDAYAASSTSPILDRVRARGIVKCGSFERPGLAIDVVETQAAAADSIGADPAQTPFHGLNVDLCRAVATVVLGSPDKIEFHSYEGADDLSELAAGEDDIAFLSTQEMGTTGVTSRIIPGPIVYIESIAAMLPVKTGIEHLKDLNAEKGVCFANGSSAEHVLPAYFAAVKQPWRPIGYTEDGEMLDAYNVQRCQILAGERTTLAMNALEGGVNALKSRILPEPFASFPIMATTSIDDGRWSSIVAWTIHTLRAADRTATDWTIDGAASMPVALGDDGLAADWQDKLLKRFHSYATMLDHSVGAHSALRLPVGLNVGPQAGGALVGPVIE